MAQARMPELAKKVREVYHLFPAETWERTRKVLDGDQPYALFVHVEELIATNKIDGLLAADSSFRELAADMYAGRHPRLRDPDLGEARWRAYQEHEAERLTQAAKEAEKHPEEMLAMRRRLMIRRIHEGRDVERWRKLLGFEGVHIDQAEILAVVGKEGEGRPAYGTGEPRDEAGGMVPGNFLDGPGGSYGEMPGFGTRTYHGPREVVLAQIPLAPADGGEAPRNPFTTEWRAREAPDGIKFPFTGDPYYTSNQFIWRSEPYEHCELPPYSDSEDEQDETDVAAEGQESNTQQGPTAVAGQAVATIRRTETQTQTVTEEQRPAHAPVTFGGFPPRGLTEATSRRREGPSEAPTTTHPATQPMAGLESFTVSTRTANPSIVITGAPADNTTQTGLSTRTRTLSEDQEWGRPLVNPKEPVRIYTPAREQITPSPPSTPSATSDVEMADRQFEDLDLGEDDDDASGQSWLVRWMNRHKVTPEVSEMIAYRGWRIHSPAVQMIRIKNFLSDEDVDRTVNWDRKLAEIGLFLQHCVRLEGAGGKSWYPDLLECTRMLRTHFVFEKYHYGERELNVDLPQPRTSASTRLPTLVDGRGIAAARLPDEELRPRYLLHRIPESVQDVDYQIPKPLLHKTFMSWFRADGNLVWDADPKAVAAGGAVGSGERGKTFGYEPDFNMALTEDEWYAKCMAGGPEKTAECLRGEANFYIHELEYIAGDVRHVEVNGKQHRVQRQYPEGEVQQRFARYRGAKRAALQQCLSHFTSVENIAIQGPYRRLVLPLTRRQKERAAEEASRDIVYQPKAIEKPPEGVKLDPLGLTFWHQEMRQATRRRAEATRGETQKAHYKFLTATSLDRSKDATLRVLVPANYLGPVTPLAFLSERERRKVAKYDLLKGLWFSLRRAYNRSPRQMLEGVVKNIELGKKDLPSWDMREELLKHRTRHVNYLPLDDMELHWLFFVCGPSTNVKAQRTELPDLGRRFEVFVKRVQTLLDDPNIEGLLASYEKPVALKDLVDEVNRGVREGDFVYDEDTAKKYCKVLANRGRLGYKTTDVGAVEISRPFCDWHPEHRINWPEGDDPWDPATNPWNAANLPPPEDTWDWELAFANVSYVNTSRKLTKNMLWSRAWRLGCELARLEFDLQHVDEGLSDETLWNARSVELQDLAGRWRRRILNADDLDEDDEEEEEEGEDDAIRIKNYGPISFGSVVMAGAPEKWGKDGMAEEEAYQVVRKGVIDELSAGDSTLWPSRPRFSRVGNDDVMTLHRERVWDWARPKVAAGEEEEEKPRFFSVNRWPVHLQSEATQERIRRSADDEMLEAMRRRAAEEAEMARVEEEVRPTEAELAEQEISRQLATPYHEAEGRKTRFYAGQTEFWGGQGQEQVRAMQALVQNVLDEEFGEDDGRAPPAGPSLFDASLFGDDVDDEDGISRMLPEVHSPDVPRSVPGELAGPPGRPPTRPRPQGPTPAPAPSAEEPIERKQPLFPPRYPAHILEEEKKTRRVHFSDENDDDDGVE